MNRHVFLKLCVFSVVACWAASTFAAEPASETVAWYDAKTWGVEGKGFSECENYFDRFPASAKGVVRDKVWRLSTNSAGMMVRFETDSPEIWVRYGLTSKTISIPHMPATGVSGIDLYAQDDKGNWSWLSVTKPKSQQIEVRMAKDITKGKRQYMMYLPLYNGVTSLEVGVPKTNWFKPVPPRKEKPILFYGTSILQGACASRPGMCHTAILGRKLEKPVINLGFSGSALMEPEVGQLISEIDACMYVLDPVPNMRAEMIEERAAIFIGIIRAKHPETPIIMVEDRTYPAGVFIKERSESNRTRRLAYSKIYAELKRKGDKNLYYIKGEDLFGTDNEATVDGSHPSDLGFMRMSDKLEPILRKALKKKWF
jgi:hypothetical protein